MTTSQSTRTDQRSRSWKSTVGVGLTYKTGRAMVRNGGLTIDGWGNNVRLKSQQRTDRVECSGGGKAVAELCARDAARQIVKSRAKDFAKSLGFDCVPGADG